MPKKPEYFEVVREEKEARWVNLENDPETKSLWWTVFRDVQSRPHVLSELLQNADDAKAKEVSVRIENNIFIFEHDGDDFTEDQFRSLCSFCYSNKQVLQTIGFRGIGFKSTFSFGDPVKLITPSFAVEFHKEQFTLPHWLDDYKLTDKLTQIQIPIEDKNILKDIRKIFIQWKSDPLPILFLKKIEGLKIEGENIHWKKEKNKSIASSIQAMFLSHSPNEIYIHAKSKKEKFPKRALKEINENIKSPLSNEVLEVASCIVEITISDEKKMNGRLYAVLPTDVKTNLPFACNAPFMQRSARRDIFSPNESPTNKWLLERIGKLAAETMLKYLENEKLSLKERARGYDFMPDAEYSDDDSIAGECVGIVKSSFEEAIKDKKIILTEKGKLVKKDKSVLVNEGIIKIFGLEKSVKLLDDEKRFPLCSYISSENQDKLVNWEVVAKIGRGAFFEVLKNKHLPKLSWKQMAFLWDYVNDNGNYYYNYKYLQNGQYGWHTYSKDNFFKDLKIIPVQGEKILYTRKDVVRLGEKRLLRSNDDWNFLSQYLKVMDPNWGRFLTRSDKEAEKASAEGIDNTSLEIKKEIEGAKDAMRTIALDETSNADEFISNFIVKFFQLEDKEKVSEEEVLEFVRVAQITAQLEAKPDNLPYINRDNYVCKKGHDIMFDSDGSLEYLIPEESQNEHLLHPDYSNFTTSASCTDKEWLEWIKSGKSGLHILPPFEHKDDELFFNREEFEYRLKMDGFSPPKYRYTNDYFIIDDWDFSDEYWNHWEKLAETDKGVWAHLIHILMKARIDPFNAKVIHDAGNGNRETLLSQLPAKWIKRFRNLPCLPDRDGNYCKPRDLLRYTILTDENNRDNKPFIDKEWDTAEFDFLLDALEVVKNLNAFDSVEELINSLHELFEEENNIHLNKVDELYHRIDQYIKNCSSQDFSIVKQAFHDNNFVLTESGDRVNALEIFSNSRQLSEVPTLRESVKNLSLWKKIEITDEPNSNWIIKRLNNSTKAIPSDLKKWLEICPEAIWIGCNKWLNLSGEWEFIDNLKYIESDEYKYLFEDIKKQVADFRNFPNFPKDILNQPPFNKLPLLSNCIKKRLQYDPNSASIVSHTWLRIIGKALCLIEIEDEKNKGKVYSLGESLLNSVVKKLPDIYVMQYIEDAPVGECHEVDVAWIGNEIYLKDMQKLKLKQPLAREISDFFIDIDEEVAKKIESALQCCFEEPLDEVEEYMRDNFNISGEIVIDEIKTTEEIKTDDSPITETVNTETENQNQKSEKPLSNPPTSTSTSTSTSSNQKHRIFGKGRIWYLSGTNPSSPKQIGQTINSTDKQTEKVKLPSQNATVIESVPVEPVPMRRSNPDTAEAAIKAVIAYEKEYGFDAKDMNDENPGNPGYDIESKRGSKKRWIEVKGLKGPWKKDAVFVSRTQMECNFDKPDIFWLYVVEYAQDSNLRKVHPIANPLSNIETFQFSGKWDKQVSEGRDKVDV